MHGGEPVALPAIEPDLTPRAALADALLPALRRPPCVIAFSGGRDSSVLLAVAAAAAREHGLEPPRAVSFGFSAADSDELGWQRMVVERVGVEWERVQIGDELDYVGPVAAAVLERHGLLFPSHAHLFQPLLERAGEGTVVTGIGGDELVDRWRFAQLRMLPRGVRRGRRRPNRGDVLDAASWLVQPRARRALMARFSRHRIPWLKEEAERRSLDERARSAATVPRRYDRYLPWLAGRRNVAVAVRGLDLLASGTDAAISHPFLDRRLMAAMARTGGALGFGHRTVAWPRLFGGLLPDGVLERSTKTGFDAVYFAGPAQRFAAEWEGRGAFEDLVDPAGLRSVWRERPLFRLKTGLLLQALWLDACGAG